MFLANVEPFEIAQRCEVIEFSSNLLCSLTLPVKVVGFAWIDGMSVIYPLPPREPVSLYPTQNRFKLIPLDIILLLPISI